MLRTRGHMINESRIHLEHMEQLFFGQGCRHRLRRVDAWS